MTEEAARAWTVLDEEAGRRVDVFLRDKLDGVGRAKLKNALENGLVRVNGRRVKKGMTVAAGDKVELELEDLTGSALPDPSIILDVVYEDAALVVVNKPAGVPTQPLRIGEVGTVANGLLARYPEMAGVGYEAREPGILHRLDVDTSGLLLAARNATVFEVLRNLLAAGGIEKEYQALVGGSMRAPQTIPYAIATDPTSATRVRVCFNEDEEFGWGGKPATTEVLSATPRGIFSLVSVRAKAARRHQVRAHLAAAGHPIVGDNIYGGPTAVGVTHHLLHASRMTFAHPVSGAVVDLTAPIPASWPS